ncbi:S-layer homology domain-containing protein [Leptolyngbya sp. CCNP1308]|uniref:S-layer homology domain-containing protein n=1 Tax=Leptolyngbya sp. CCNP1308 TaxID=3110255 RepID=UPI002B20FB79|nr:S-layer homology domain-containing protein [Leptolyngbya sp. CCNP1308]MEA5451272.1 S-layer homology domain-containing protein [Leptolyngbya sp. CCNP1308]
MSTVSNLSAKTTALVALGSVAIAGLALPATAQTAEFDDVGTNYWARPFIENLAEEEIIAGFPDGTFRPDQPVTRAQFAAIVRNAFQQPLDRTAPRFSDVPSNYWASAAIDDAYGQGFLSGYPNGAFQPETQIPRVQVLVALANGLDYSTSGSVNEVLGTYRDASQIPDYGRGPVAAATQNELVVNYPNVDVLGPQRTATRADVAAFIYQALVAQGRMPALQSGLSASNYIVGYTPGTGTGTGNGTSTSSPRLVPNGTQLDVRYPNADVDIVVAPGQAVATNLQTTQAILNGQGQVLIPVGSTVQGRIVPVEIRGSSVTAAKFVADTLTVNGRTYNINAESSAIAATDSVNSGTLQGALITGAAESILASITGNSGLGSVVGAIINGENQPTSTNAVVVIRPSDLDLTLRSDFTVDAIANN